MSDPIEQLSRLGDTVEGALAPLPASAVRARGDQIRRRRHGLVAGATAVAVAAVAVPVLALTVGGDADRPDRLAPQPTASDPVETVDADGSVDADRAWPTAIPEDFPLASGWPTESGPVPENDPDYPPLVEAGDLQGCDPVDGGTPGDRVTARYDDLVERDLLRQLQLFPDDRAAGAYVDSIQAGYQVCDAQAPPQSESTTTVDGGPLGDQSVVVMTSGDGGAYVIYAVRVGNGVLVEIVDDDSFDINAAELAVVTEESLDGVVDAMAALQRTATVDPGTGSSTDGGLDEPAGTTEIPDDVPLDAEMVDMGADGEYNAPYRPVQGEPGLTLELCGQGVWPVADDDGPAAADGLVASATGPEYSDYRHLVTLPTVDRAVDAVQGVRDALATCTAEGNQVWTPVDEETGYDSVTFALSYSDGLGLTVYQVTRVGHAVLLTARYGEGALTDAPLNVADRTAVTRAIAPSLCVFTADGC